MDCYSDCCREKPKANDPPHRRVVHFLAAGVGARKVPVNDYRRYALTRMASLADIYRVGENPRSGCAESVE
jgi:hypothetical protein